VTFEQGYTFKDVLRSFVQSIDTPSDQGNPEDVTTKIEDISEAEEAIKPELAAAPEIQEIKQPDQAPEIITAHTPEVIPQEHITPPEITQHIIIPDNQSPAPTLNANPFAKDTGLKSTADNTGEVARPNIGIDDNSNINLSESELEELKLEAEGAEDQDDFNSKIDEKLGNRLIRVGLLTQWQRHVAVNYQRKIYAHNLDVSIGEVIVRIGYCTAEQIEQAALDENLDAALFLPKEKEINHKWMGSRMITAGLITAPQRDRILDEQALAKARGEQKRFGELAAELNFCTQSQLQSLIDERTQRLMDDNW
jgi:hypothetical protein